MTDIKTKKLNLNEVLQKTYNSKADLSSTQTCKCTCCAVAMPSMNFCEFLNIITDLWQNANKEIKVEMIETSLNYFFKNDFTKWGIQSLVKPCMFLDKKTGLCLTYETRPLNCRLFGLWPKEAYEKRVEKFEKSYSKYGLTKEDLPLHKQCEKVTQTNDKVKINQEMIDSMFTALDNLDKLVGKYTDLQIKNKENYRTFHDWLLVHVFGEKWLTDLTNFMSIAGREEIISQIEAIKSVLKQSTLLQ